MPSILKPSMTCRQKGRGSKRRGRGQGQRQRRCGVGAGEPPKEAPQMEDNREAVRYLAGKIGTGNGIGSTGGY